MNQIERKCRDVFAAAGGDPNNAGPLVEWSIRNSPSRDWERGVIVTEEGQLVAETRYHRSAGATYVTDEDKKRYRLSGSLVSRAVGQLQRQLETRCIHVKLSQVYGGPVA